MQFRVPKMLCDPLIMRKRPEDRMGYLGRLRFQPRRDSFRNLATPSSKAITSMPAVPPGSFGILAPGFIGL